MLYSFRDIVSYFSKIDDFNLPRLHLVHPLAVTPVEFRRDLWHQKTRSSPWPLGYRGGLEALSLSVILCLAVLLELRLATDRQTPQHSTASIASSGKNRV